MITPDPDQVDWSSFTVVPANEADATAVCASPLQWVGTPYAVTNADGIRYRMRLKDDGVTG